MLQTIESTEQELTYLVSDLPPETEKITPTRLKDVYLPDTDGIHPRLRLRKKGDEYEITKKVPLQEGDASAHSEMTIPLSKDEFDALAKSSKKTVEKDRYEITLNGHLAEVDVFVGELKGLVLIDFEFDSEQQKNTFVAPDVCLADVTQETFIAGGKLAGKTYNDIKHELDRYGYKALSS